jgi:hypothetical protein
LNFGRSMRGYGTNTALIAFNDQTNRRGAKFHG